ncbi:MAG: M48 family metallopeptidase [Pseudomonadota bacterium]
MTTASPDGQTPEVTGRYFDGQSAVSQHVLVGFGGHSLVIYSHADRAIAHWALGSVRAIAMGGIGEMTLTPGQDDDERLIIDDPMMIRALRRACPDLERRSVGKRGLQRAALWGFGAVGSVLAIVFVLVPMLAQQLAPMIPPEREQALGRAVSAQVERLLVSSDEEPICSTPEGDAALARMTERLVGQMDLPYPLNVRVLRSPMVNAVAMPGGHVLLFDGLIKRADRPEEVAGVLAHEIAHVIHRDATVGVLRTAGSAGLLSIMVGDVFGGGMAAALGEAAINASFTREAEARADETALAMLADAALPSAPFSRFFDRMREEHGDTPEALRYFASHPSLSGRAERALAADTVADDPYRPALSDNDWTALQAICAG